jgi:hypothetical protein
LIISLFWKQCHDGGQIAPMCELNKESSLQDFTETYDNPFDVLKDPVIGIDSRKARKKTNLKNYEKK